MSKLVNVQANWKVAESWLMCLRVKNLHKLISCKNVLLSYINNESVDL